MADTLLHTVSLCAGVGMLDVGLAAGLEYMGIRCRPVLYAEREAYAAAVLLTRMEEGSLDAAPVWWGDFTQLDARQFRGVVDCVVAGFPCQDLSVAGKRAGLDGERSGLFFEVLRFACDCGARWLFLENVSAIASASATVVYEGEVLEERAASRVLGELADCGWDAEWLTLSAPDVGASHKRERWFCLAWKNLDDAGCGALRDDGKNKRPASRKVNETSGAGGLLGNAGLQHGNLQQWPDGAEYQGTGGKLVNAISNRWGTRRMPDGKDDRDFSAATGEITLVNPECARRAQTGSGSAFYATQESEQGIGDMADSKTVIARSMSSGRKKKATGSVSCLGNVAYASKPGSQGGELLNPCFGDGRRQEAHGSATEFRSLFSPGPADERWSEILRQFPEFAPATESPVCRVADGLAERLDECRPQRLRCIGNGVVPLQAATAFVLLAERAGLRLRK